ncbi:MAG: T9SS type A sorting domain-containing protein [Arcicella sp.]|nr:T9SS type A sorting domain-containing protein [Arcicella sp.]
MSIEEVEKKNIKIYPNPTTSIVNVATPNETINQINVYDMHGRLLKSQKGNNDNDQINIQELPNGMYMIEVKTRQGTKIAKLFKQ